jgi:hypothetical protein
LLQKQGNYLDDSRLTNAVRDADSLGEAYAAIDFGLGLVIPAYYLDRFFEIGTNGRRIAATLIVFSSFVYLSILLLQFRVLDRFGLLFFALLFSISGELTVYTSTGLLSYPLLILLSVILIHFLLKFDAHVFSVRTYFLASTLFTLLVFLNDRIILAACATTFVLSFGVLVQNSFSLRSVIKATGQGVLILAAPVVTVFISLYFLAPTELLNPHRGFEFYFFKSSYPPSLGGAALFFGENSLNLLSTALSPHPLVGIPAPTKLVHALLGLFFLIGLLTSWKSKVFGFTLFFLVGTLGHIVLNLASLVPYGNLRYFLPFYVAYPVITAFGISQVGKGFLLLSKKFNTERYSNSFYFLSVIGALVVLFHYQSSNADYNQKTEKITNANIAIAVKAKNKGLSSIVTDVWTAETMRAEQWINEDDIYFNFRTNVKTALKKQPAEQLDDLSKWQAFLLDHDSFSTITSIPFSKGYYGSFYDLALEHFEIVSLPGTRRYFFKNFSRRGESGGRSQANSDQFDLQISKGISIENVLPENSAKRVAGSAYRIQFGNISDGAVYKGGMVKWVFPTAMRAGQVLSAYIDLWSDDELDLNDDLIFQIARNDSNKNEYVNKRVKYLHKTPQTVTVDLQLDVDHESIRIALIYRGDSPISVYMTPPSLKY